jgi:transglutaminase-like putative cysteine protease
MQKVLSAAGKRAGNWIDWAALLLLFLPLYIVFNNVQGAGWINPQPSYLTVLVLSMLTGFLSSGSRLKLKYAVAIGLGGGLPVLAWQASNVLPSQSGFILTRVFRSVDALWSSLSGSVPSEGTIYFAVFLIILTWAVGFICTWQLIRRQNAWYAVAAGFVILLVNLDYLTFNSYGVFFLFIFVSIFLLGFVKIVKQDSGLAYINLKSRFKRALWLGVTLVILGAILIGGTWLAPEIRANQLQNLADRTVNAGQAVDNLKLNLFAPVKAKGAMIKSVDQETLFFSSRPNLSREVQFVISSPEAPGYWRVRRYDIYNSFGWASSVFGDEQLQSGVSPRISPSNIERSKITYSVIDKLKTDIVLSTGQFYSADIAVNIHPFLSEVQAGQTPNTAGDDTASITTLRVFKPDEAYRVTSLVGAASVEELAGAGKSYPAWISSQYLQLPPTLPQEVIKIARSLNRRSQTPYDTVLAVKSYLSRFKYLVDGTNPPLGGDEVQDFLTVQKTGNCTNFATAAVVLLRADGIPARLCTGYVPGKYDKSSGTYTVEARDYHAWPEVYFPGYGWVEVEVTPGISTAPADTNSSALPTPTDTSSSLDLPPVTSQEPAPPQAQTSPAAPIQKGSNGGLYRAIGIPGGIALSAGLMLMFFLRRYRRMDYAATVYARMQFLARLARVSVKPYQTPLEFSQSLIKVFPGQSGAISEITQAYVESRFSRNKKLTADESESLAGSWRVVAAIIFNRRFYGF